ncbi:MAG: tetratricopeptide (TPR) repeat protein [Paraglaciecola sp.]|jgi:tetratricopeptide (TPR) repeat protein
MIITERFVFIHMHKTGGQTLNNIIKRCIPKHQVIGYHYPCKEVPAKSIALPLVGMVRNPWDWYISWYAFNNGPKLRNPLFAIVSHNGQANLNTTISNLINLGSDTAMSQQHRQQLIQVLPETLQQNRGVGLTKDDIRNFSDNNNGYYSWMFQRMFGDYKSDQTHIGKFENLQQDFLGIMQHLAVEQTPCLQDEFNKRERKNVSQHSHYSHYYDTPLQRLVAEKEQRLIDNFNYRFDVVGPSETMPENRNNTAQTSNYGFQKLLGRAHNYLKLHDSFDAEAIKDILAKVPDITWRESGREKRFDIHRDTEALILIKFEDYHFTPPKFSALHTQLREVIQPLVEHISKYYQDNGFVGRMVFAKLMAGGKISEHSDLGYSLLNCHRIHIPIVTNEDNLFFVGGEQKNMKVGEFWEINNAGPHSVDNHSDEDRIHLIIDWVPNPLGKTVVEAILAPEHNNVTATQSIDTAQINVLVADAYRMHRAGKVKQAKSIYLKVLDVEPKHVVCNNLLGLLCLQTGEYKWAIAYIETALSVNPKDAQAHANIGLAFSKLKQLNTAVEHFQQSIILESKNPKTHHNLGNIYKELGQLGNAITCYQQALAIHYGYPEAHYNLGSALLIMGRYAESVASLKQALTLKPDFIACRIELEKASQGLKVQQK